MCSGKYTLVSAVDLPVAPRHLVPDVCHWPSGSAVLLRLGKLSAERDSGGNCCMGVACSKAWGVTALLVSQTFLPSHER